jgi:hypothetical protein
MRALLLGLASATALLGQVDAREMIRRAVAADESNWRVARNYMFSERVDLRYLDSLGRVKSKEVETFDVTLLDGSPYRRLAARDDRPLPPGEESKEQRRLATSAVQRRKETAPQRAQRQADYEKRPEWQREVWRELPEAFDFRLAGEELWDGNRLYVIQATPRQGYQPRSRTGKVLVHIQGKLWVDRRDYHLVKAEVEVVDTISVGLFLVRVAKGSRAAYEQTLVNDEVWLPRRVRVFASARVGLLKVLRIEQEVVYGERREFQTGSLVISHLKPR